MNTYSLNASLTLANSPPSRRMDRYICSLKQRLLARVVTGHETIGEEQTYDQYPGLAQIGSLCHAAIANNNNNNNNLIELN